MNEFLCRPDQRCVYRVRILRLSRRVEETPQKESFPDVGVSYTGTHFPTLAKPPESVLIHI